VPNRKAEWAFLCQKASFNSDLTLNVTALFRRLVVDKLPVSIGEFLIVIALGPSQSSTPEHINVSMAITNPAGQDYAPTDKKAVNIQVINEYLLVTLYEMPIITTGTYRFVFSFNGQRIVEVSLPVSVAPSERAH